MSQTGSVTQLQLAQKIVARIVHDMVSPIGAISNGVELLSLMPSVPAPELSLIDESCAAAASRLRMFRLAFGSHKETDVFSHADSIALVKDCAMDGRCQLQWNCHHDIPRRDAQLAVLAMLCFRSALPRGGQIMIDEKNGLWTISCDCETMQVERSLWHIISGMNDGSDIQSMHIQFLALRLNLLAAGKDVDLDLFGSSPIIRF